MILSFLRRLQLGASSLQLVASGLELEAYIFYNLYQGRRRNTWASILNQKTSHTCARTPGLEPGGRV